MTNSKNRTVTLNDHAFDSVADLVAMTLYAAFKQRLESTSADAKPSDLMFDLDYSENEQLTKAVEAGEALLNDSRIATGTRRHTRASHPWLAALCSWHEKACDAERHDFSRKTEPRAVWCLEAAGFEHYFLGPRDLDLDIEEEIVIEMMQTCDPGFDDEDFDGLEYSVTEVHLPTEYQAIDAASAA